MASVKDCKVHGRSTQKTGSKTRRLSKKLRRSVTITICSGCGNEMTRKEN